MAQALTVRLFYLTLDGDHTSIEVYHIGGAMNSRIVLCVALLMLGSPARSQQDCSQFVKDAFNIAVRQTGVGSSSQYRRWQCSASFSSHNDALGTGLNIGAVVYDVPLQFGGTFNQNSVESWKQQNCSEAERATDYRAASYEFTRKFAPEAAELAKHCLDSQRPTALRCNLAGDGADKVFSATWLRSPGDNQAPIVQSFTVRGGTCVNSPQHNGRISEGGTLAICTIEDGKDLVVALETSRGSCFQNFAFNPTIAVVSGTVRMTAPLTFSADVVDIRPDAKILTNGHQLTFAAARELRISGAPTIDAFDAAHSPDRKLHGRSAGAISIQAPRVTGSQLSISNFGEDGLDGRPGSTGAGGRDGQGRRQQDLRGCTGGRSGEDGAPGGAGTRGGNGGAGGAVTIAVRSGLDVAGNLRVLVSTSRRLADGTMQNCSGSCGGLAGRGGAGGPGGPGGRGGRGSGGCGGTSAGNQGPTGARGEDGTPGANVPVSVISF